MSGPELITLGCRLNYVESEAMRLAAAGEDDLVIVNSCAVTAEAVRQARKAIRRIARERPTARIVVTGCAAQTEPETFARMPEVARVVGNAEKMDATSFTFPTPPPFVPSVVEGREAARAPKARTSTALGTNGVGVAEMDGPDYLCNVSSLTPLPLAPSPPFVLSEVEGRAPGAPPTSRSSTALSANGFLEAGVSEKIRVSDIMAVRETAPHLAAGFSTRTRAFVEVQNGCDHRCTFCIIPYARGNSRSVPASAVIDRILAEMDRGAREVVLTGVDLTSYGPDLPGAPTLGLLVERILRHVPSLKRLRLSSLDSVEIDDRLCDLITGDPRVMPHLHLSLQAGDDMILKRMKRRHSRAQSVELIQRLKAARPEIAIGADIIAGFPTEDDAMAGNTLALIDECDIVFGHIFPYSPRAGTPAARMPQVDAATIKARAKALRDASARRRATWLRGLIGTTQSVLVEGQGDRGHAGTYAEAQIAGGATVGEIVPMRVTGVEGDVLMGSRA